MSWDLYDTLIKHLGESDARVQRACLGLTWSYCQSEHGLGLAMSPGQPCRTLSWPGTLRGRPLRELAEWVHSWDPYEATIGLAAINTVINNADNPLLQQATPLPTRGNLALFEYLRPRLEHKRIVVVGRYPGLDQVLDGLDYRVLERQPGSTDLPDSAAEYELPQADWVFLTASALVNKTLPRLAELSRDAVTVLMGPSTPWLAEWAEYGIDFLAGVRVEDNELLKQVAEEGGGVRLFDEAVRYLWLDVAAQNMQRLKQEIAEVAEQRLQQRSEMEQWYAAGNTTRFPQWQQLEEIDARLSRLDLRYKRQWDARSKE